MKLLNLNRCALSVCVAPILLIACGGPQVTPFSSTQLNAAPSDMGYVKSARRFSPDGIVYTPIDVRLANSSYDLDLNNDGQTDFTITASETQQKGCGNRTNYQSTLSLSTQGSNGVELSGSYPAKLVSGSAIGRGESFSQGSWTMEYLAVEYKDQSGQCTKFTTEYGNWPPDDQNGYLGLAFVIGGHKHYGWAAVTVVNVFNAAFTATLTGYAYQTKAGKSINAGQM